MSRRETFPAIVLAAVIASAVACSSGPHSPSNVGVTNPMAMGDVGTDASSPASASSNEPDSAPADVRSGGDAPSLSADAMPPISAPRCDPAHVWKSQGLAPSGPLGSFARFGGISLDEKTIAWTSATGTIEVADRAAFANPFGFPVAIDTSATPIANDRVALAPTGVVVFAVSTDRRRVVAFNRASIGAAWSTSTRLQFANLDAMTTAEGGGQFSEIVLGADGGTLLYLFAPPGGPPLLYESKWDARQHAWTAGVALTNPELASASSTLRRRATGASSDGRTLFFFDETTGRERAAWRDSPTSPFSQFVDVTGMSEAAPNDPCDTLYFQEGASDSGVAGPAIAR